MQKGKRYRDTAAGVLIFIGAIGYLWGTKAIRTTLNNGLGGSKFMPTVIGVLLLVFTAIQIAASFRSEHKSDPGCRVLEKGKRRNVILTFVFFALYAGLLNRIGFLVTTFCYLSGQIYILSPAESRSAIKSAGVALIADLVIYLVFTRAFSLALPRGVLAF